METLFNEEWSLWGPLGETAALPWSDGGLLDSCGWPSKSGEGLAADGAKPQTGLLEDLWEPFVDLANDADFKDWMEINMDPESLSVFSESIEQLSAFPPALAPSSIPPEGDLLGPTLVEVAEEKRHSDVITNTATNLSDAKSEATSLFLAMMEEQQSLPSPGLIVSSPERPSSRDSSFSSADSSADSCYLSGPPSVEVEDQTDLLSLYMNNSSAIVVDERSIESNSISEKGQKSTSRKSARASSSRPKSARQKREAKPKIGDSKVRKRDQNRDAAIRYREKKRIEAELGRQEEEKLERKNHELRDRVDGLSSEIKYLKGLMKELLQAKQK